MIRSLLYVPAHQERFVSKAHERGADAIILDLEDAVPPGEKANARAALAKAAPQVAQNGALSFVRINAGDDADAEAACRAGAYGLLLPKSREPEALRRLAARLETAERAMGREPMRFVPMIEDPGAIFDARAIGSATPRVMAMMTGGEDMATALGAEPSPEGLRFPKMMVHLAAKAVGVMSLGLIRTVADYRDTEGVTRAAREARELGFDGASCVHPSSVPILNAAFAPSPEQVEAARRLIAAAEAAAKEGKGAFVLDGKMVDEPVVARAKALLARAR
ncbi:MAG: CoA ester lyase [Alphaproteobacteria bacterium]|nr:CoA ester lyase [Alphaproteobacteria bacterium]